MRAVDTDVAREVDSRDNVKHNGKNDQLFVRMTIKVDDREGNHR